MATYRIVSNTDPLGDSDGCSTSESMHTPNVTILSGSAGQLYVIGNANSEVLGVADTSATSSIAPLPTISNQRSLAPKSGGATRSWSQMSFAQESDHPREEKRRTTHNEVERRRRDTINTWIMKLGDIIPDADTLSDKRSSLKETSHAANQRAHSKSGILARACNYIHEIRAANQKLKYQINLKHDDLAEENLALTEQVANLKKENENLRRLLKNSAAYSKNSKRNNSESIEDTK